MAESTVPTPTVNAVLGTLFTSLSKKRELAMIVSVVKEVLIMVNGHNKARALQQAVEGAVNQMWTITALQMHPKGIIVADEAACAELKVGTYNYFKDIEKDNLCPCSLLK